MLEDSGINVQSIVIEPTTLIDQVSSTDFYLGMSKSFKDQAKEIWRIKRIWQDGTVWYVGYPGGNQDFTFVWNDRADYVYS